MIDQLKLENFTGFDNAARQPEISLGRGWIITARMDFQQQFFESVRVGVVNDLPFMERWP